jgi:two-component system C4-dicarboxylate transport sensor histidine kinase DctB
LSRFLLIPEIWNVGLKGPQVLYSLIRRHTLLSIGLISFAALILCAAYLSFSLSWKRGIQDLQENAESRIDIFSLQLFSSGKKYSYLPELVSNYGTIENALLRQNDVSHIAKANALLANLNVKAGSDLIFVMNLEGTTIASSNWKEQNSLVGENYAFRPYFQDALKEGTGRFYAMGVTTKVPGYYISHLAKKNGRPLGVVVVKIDINDLDIRRATSGHEVVVTDQQGVIFLSSREEWKYRPLQELASQERGQLENTRQYEGVLTEPMPITLKQAIKPDEQLISITKEKRWYGDDESAYFVKSRMLANGKWTVHVLTSTDKIERQATQASLMAAGGVVLLLFLCMHLNQLRIRARERKESELALRQSHEALSQANESLKQRNGELETLSEELRLKSITDPLTGLFNRRFFLDTASKLVSAANRHNLPLSVMMIDVDHFKQINDLHGHLAGDRILLTLACLYTEEMREVDVLARFGGEEFIVALPYTDALTAQIVAERIRAKVMNHSIEIDGKTVRVTISAGISQYRSNEGSIKEAIQRADKALYEAKECGRNRVVMSEQSASILAP